MSLFLELVSSEFAPNDPGLFARFCVDHGLDYYERHAAGRLVVGFYGTDHAGLGVVDRFAERLMTTISPGWAAAVAARTVSGGRLTRVTWSLVTSSRHWPLPAGHRPDVVAREAGLSFLPADAPLLPVAA